MTDAVQVVVPPRWSETVTSPSEPLIVLKTVDATCDPSDTPTVGALIDRTPAVRVKVAWVAAPAGRAVAIDATTKAEAALARAINFHVLDWPFLIGENETVLPRTASGTKAFDEVIGFACLRLVMSYLCRRRRESYDL